MSPREQTRILYVNHTGQLSGAERVLIDTLRTLDRSRYEPVVTCPAQGGLASEVLALDVEWLQLAKVRARFSWRPDRIFKALPSLFETVFALRRHIRAIVPDLIHANSVRAGLVASLAAVGTRTPVIWHVHDTLPQHPVSTLLRGFVLLARNTSAIAVSHATARSFRGQVPITQKIQVIHSAVDLSRFPSGRPGRQAFRERLGLNEEDFLICAVGQICARKGLLELVEAFRRIHAEAPRAHLAIVGKVVFSHEKSYVQNLYEAVKTAGLEQHVHFTGELRDVASVLQGADLAVLNSRDEPFGLVIVESMASGTPVLATRVGGIPEIIADGENGWLVAAGDANALAAALLILASDRDGLRRVAEHAQRTVAPKFSLDRYRKELAAFYDHLGPNRSSGLGQRNRPVLIKTGNH